MARRDRGEKDVAVFEGNLDSRYLELQNYEFVTPKPIRISYLTFTIRILFHENRYPGLIAIKPISEQEHNPLSRSILNEKSEKSKSVAALGSLTSLAILDLFLCSIRCH